MGLVAAVGESRMGADFMPHKLVMRCVSLSN